MDSAIHRGTVKRQFSVLSSQFSVLGSQFPSFLEERRGPSTSLRMTDLGCHWELRTSEFDVYQLVSDPLLNRSFGINELAADYLYIIDK